MIINQDRLDAANGWLARLETLLAKTRGAAPRAVIQGRIESARASVTDLERQIACQAQRNPKEKPTFTD